MPPTLNVLMVNTQQTGGGAARVSELLSQALRRGGSYITSFVEANPDHDPHGRHAGHWRETAWAERLSRHGFPDLGRVTPFLWGCREEYASADVLHLHNLHGDYVSIAALPLWGFDKPVVWTLHDFWALTGNCATPGACTRWKRGCGGCPQLGVYPMSRVDRSHLYRRLKPKLISAARPLLVSPSRWLAERVRELPAFATLPLRVIPNPVDCDLFTPTDARDELRRQFGLRPDHATVIMAGNTWADPMKGGEYAIAALRHAAQRVPALQVLVIGGSSDRLLGASGLPGRALPFARDRATLARAYACADICLFPSLAENYPLTTLEAMACGIPVVAYDVGGVREQIVHLKTGYIARGGCVGELAAGVVRLTTSLAATKRMGRAGREHIARTCNVEVVAARYRQAYADAIRAWRHRHASPSPRRARGRLARWVARKASWEDQNGSPRSGSRRTTLTTPAVHTSSDESRTSARAHGLPNVRAEHCIDTNRSGQPSSPAAAAPHISVVTPAYNQGQFIERCIQSVFEQGYPDFEHIVYDNCSRDQTVEILRRYPHVDWVSEPDTGQSDALNKAIRKARGEIIAWINADDFYEPGAFALAARELRRDTGVRALAGRVHLVDPEGNITQTTTPCFVGLEFLVKFWEGGYGLCQPGVFFRREVIERVGAFRTDLHFAMDYDFWLRMVQHYPIKTVDQVLARYVVHPASKSGSAHFGRGFNQELARVSQGYWERPWSPRYWRLSRGCRRFLAEPLANAIVSAHTRRDQVDWASLRTLLWRHPLGLFRRHLLAVFFERVLGVSTWNAIKRVLGISASETRRPDR